MSTAPVFLPAGGCARLSSPACLSEARRPCLFFQAPPTAQQRKTSWGWCVTDPAAGLQTMLRLRREPKAKFPPALGCLGSRPSSSKSSPGKREVRRVHDQARPPTRCPPGLPALSTRPFFSSAAHGRALGVSPPPAAFFDAPRRKGTARPGPSKGWESRPRHIKHKAGRRRRRNSQNPCFLPTFGHRLRMPG